MIAEGSLAEKAYKSHEIQERHRHRYEFNNLYREKSDNSDMIFSGLNPERNLVEIVELKSHPWFVAVQFHPEFASRPNKPHPLFRILSRLQSTTKSTDSLKKAPLKGAFLKDSF